MENGGGGGGYWVINIFGGGTSDILSPPPQCQKWGRNVPPIPHKMTPMITDERYVIL